GRAPRRHHRRSGRPQRDRHGRADGADRMSAARDFLGRGWRFRVGVDPGSGRITHSGVALDPVSGRIPLSEHEEDIRGAIWIILSTARGERVMRPDFGCGADDLVFEVMGTATLGLVESAVRDALAVYEPRIDQVSVIATPGDGQLLVTIDYRVRTTNSRF